MKKYSVLLTIPESNTYYIRNNTQFANAFKKRGHKVITLNRNISNKELSEYVIDAKINLVIQINQPKLYSLPNDVIHICWYQDVFDEQKHIKKFINKNSIIYTLGNPYKIGLGFIPSCLHKGFFTGVDKKIIFQEELKRDIDVNHIAFIPKPNAYDTNSNYVVIASTLFLYLFKLFQVIMPFKYFKKIFFIRKLLNNLPNFFSILPSKIISIGMQKDIKQIIGIIKNNYTTLGGNLDILKIKKNIKNKYNSDYFNFLWSKFKYIVRDYPRYLDRISIGDTLVKISDSLNIFIAGYNWKLYSKYKKISHDHIESYSQLISIYKSSKITLCNNNHGLGMHSRVLEAMACGSFILMNESPLSNLDGGMETSFIKGVHYDEYNKDNLKEKIDYWIKNETKRLTATKKAIEIIKNNHLWENRVDEIISDINKL